MRVRKIFLRLPSLFDENKYPFNSSYLVSLLYCLGDTAIIFRTLYRIARKDALRALIRDGVIEGHKTGTVKSVTEYRLTRAYQKSPSRLVEMNFSYFNRSLLSGIIKIDGNCRKTNDRENRFMRFINRMFGGLSIDCIDDIDELYKTQNQFGLTCWPVANLIAVEVRGRYYKIEIGNFSNKLFSPLIKVSTPILKQFKINGSKSTLLSSLSNFTPLVMSRLIDDPDRRDQWLKQAVNFYSLFVNENTDEHTVKINLHNYLLDQNSTLNSTKQLSWWFDNNFPEIPAKLAEIGHDFYFDLVKTESEFYNINMGEWGVFNKTFVMPVNYSVFTSYRDKFLLERRLKKLSKRFFGVVGNVEQVGFNQGGKVYAYPPSPDDKVKTDIKIFKKRRESYYRLGVVNEREFKIIDDFDRNIMADDDAKQSIKNGGKAGQSRPEFLVSKSGQELYYKLMRAEFGTGWRSYIAANFIPNTFCIGDGVFLHENGELSNFSC